MVTDEIINRKERQRKKKKKRKIMVTVKNMKL